MRPGNETGWAKDLNSIIRKAYLGLLPHAKEIAKLGPATTDTKANLSNYSAAKGGEILSPKITWEQDVRKHMAACGIDGTLVEDRRVEFWCGNSPCDGRHDSDLILDRRDSHTHFKPTSLPTGRLSPGIRLGYKVL